MRQSDEKRRSERTVAIALLLFFGMSFFGYQIGRDLAQRENAVERAGSRAG